MILLASVYIKINVLYIIVKQSLAGRTKVIVCMTLFLMAVISEN